MKLDMQPRHFALTRNILISNLDFKKVKVYAFGSRARGYAKQYSDLDLAIDYNGKKMPFEIYAKLINDFRDSSLPYFVDIVDLNAISKEFKEHIQSTLIEIELK